jgi:hypothetical protein
LIARPLVLALAALTVGCSSGAALGDGSFPAEPLATIESAAGMLSIEVRTSPTQPPERGRASIEYLVRADGEPVDDLDLEVLPWMPSMGHGASVHPTVTPMGEGRYEVANVDLYMAGHWELRATFSGPMVDEATVSFDVR